MSIARAALWLAMAALVGMLTGIFTGSTALWQPSAVCAAVLLATGLRSIPSLRSFAFTAWIIAAVTTAMIYPLALTKPGGVDLKSPWLMLLVVQSVMFGMGTQMSLTDFKGVVRMPWPVLIGFIGHFTVMPLTGWALTKVFSFPPEIAAGVILIGCCPSGLASNVMSWIARANLPLAVTITACSTVAAPFMTPLLMNLLAGELVEVPVVKLMLDTVKMMIVPLCAAFVHDWLKSAGPGPHRAVRWMAAASAAALAVLACGGWEWLELHLSGAALNAAGVAGYFCAAAVAGLAWHVIATRLPVLLQWMPVLSMAGIIYFTAVTTAAGRDNLLRVGPLLVLVAALHNGAGYFFGYWLSRAARLDGQSCRTVAFEVGLQNGGMGTGLAGAMGKLSTMGLASAVFSPWMNISGSLLANWWRRRKAEG